MFDLISKTDIPSKIANRFKYAVVFEDQTGQRFTVYRNDRQKVDADINFYGHDAFMSIAIRNEEGKIA